MNCRQTERAIKLIKDTFEVALAKALNLERISAPLFVHKNSGINDDLNGTERPVSFDLKCDASEAVIVHSLAKWKRLALKAYQFNLGEGLYTDMNAIRRDEDPDNIHSIYVDQWDWELIIDRQQRTLSYLQETVRKIVSAVNFTLYTLKVAFPEVATELNESVTFITTQELENLYPTFTPKQRENAFAKTHKTIFIMQIGDKLQHGEKHDGRAPDYDDWSLNGDLIYWNPILQSALEISSMGIRVDAESLQAQLQKTNTTDRLKYPYHQQILANQLPLTIGGGIGQSRLCMLLLQKQHIGEVQVSLWPQSTIDACERRGIHLL